MLAGQGETVGLKVSNDLRAGMVTIGLPVYNGAVYLREALDSLLAQDYADFEIIISDNGSDDETEAICREYAGRDARISYYRSDQNRGALWNAVRVYELARGEYFMWAAHDDRRHPQYLSRCVPALEGNPRALFCCTGIKLIDEVGNDVSETFPYRCYPPTGATSRERLRALLRSTSWLHTYSLIRTPALAQTNLGTHMWGADVVQIAELCMRGEVEFVPEKLFDYRYFATKTNESLAQGISTAHVKVVPSWSDLAADLMAAVQRSPLNLSEKLSLTGMMLLELCFRKTSIGYGMRKEGLDASRRAFASGKYLRGVALASLGLLIQTVYFIERLANSVRYRRSKLKRAFFPREQAPSARKPG
jgi:glycosyltransferase involved in cell wall biosynthesis